MQRPAGVTVLAFAMFTVAAISFVIGFFCFAAGPAVEDFFRVPGMPMYRIMGAAAVGIVALIFGFLCSLAAAGLWRMQLWGRSLTIVLIVISVAVSILGVIAGLVFLRMMTAVLRIIALGVDSLILWYLFQPHVRDAFERVLSRD
jgi:hypothetical protein